MSLGSKPAKYQQYTPPDLQGLRGQNIALLESLLAGGGNGGRGLEAIFGQLSPFSPSAMGTSQSATMGGGGGGMGTQAPGGFGVSQFLSQPSPEQRALDTALPQLQGILSGQITPDFDRNIALANQQGGRFGSANAILRGEALRHILNQQNQAAQTLGMLSANAGQGQQRQAGLADIETQRRLQLIMGLLGAGQQASMGGPIVQTQAASGGFGGLLSGLLGAGLGAFTGGLGTAAAGALGGQIFGGNKKP